MKLQIIQPQEVEVFYILPAIRSCMASAMKKQGMRQKEIAGLLRVQESTISHYLSSKRAADVDLGGRFEKEVAEAAKRVKTKDDLVRETQRLLDIAREEKVLCRVHMQVGDVPKGCEVCFEK